MLDYLFLDASFFRMHPGSPAEPVLAAWGIATTGKPVFVGLVPGSGESTDAWADFLTDLTGRGLSCPLLVVSDGARGLIAAVEQVFPAALRQRCLIHRLRNVVTKIPAGMQAEIRDGYWACFDTENLGVEPGPKLVELVDTRLRNFENRYARAYPAAMTPPDCACYRTCAAACSNPPRQLRRPHTSPAATDPAETVSVTA